jgi:rhomboid family GlyGly-CTERM serine protease
MWTERYSILIRQGALPLTLIVICLLLQFFEPASSHWLRYERNPIINGEWWRLLSGNFVHLSWEHLLMNLAGLVLIWLLLGRLLTLSQWLAVIVSSSLAVGIGLLAFNPQLDWYVGLSGMLHGMFVAGLVNNIRRGYRLEWLLLLALMAKLIWEQTSGALPGSTELAGGTVIVDAHLYGAISGAVASLFIKVKR